MRTLRVGLHGAEPLVFRDSEGVVRGFGIDVLEHIATIEGWELEYVDGTWAECLEGLRAGSLDLLFPILPSVERELSFDFTREAMFSTWGRVFVEEDSLVESVLDLEGLTVAVVSDDGFNLALRELVSAFNLRVTFLELDDVAAVFRAMEEGRAQAGATESMAGYWNLPPGGGLRATPVVFRPAAPHLAVPRGRNARVLAALDANLARLKADRGSVYYRSWDRWVGGPPRPGLARWIWWALAGAVGLLAVFAAFSFTLRSQVQSRTLALRHSNEELKRQIAERLEGERRREALEAQLRHSQKMESVGQLASGLAHDFRNLLTVIGAHAERVRKSAVGDAVILESVSTLEEAVSQASTMARSLLTFSRRLPTVREPLDLARATEESGRMLRRSLPAGIRLLLSLTAEARPWILADETQIKQVLLNLALNGCDAMPEGGTLRIGVEVSSEHPERAELVVTDQGQGMSAEVRDHLFEAFFTTKGESGTGLGLATVQHIVEEHEGTIAVESEMGVGSTFRVSFPVIDAPARPAGEASGARRLPPAGQGEMILLAEDNRQVRQVLAATLTSFGYTVLQCGDGSSALACFREERSRVRMAVMDVDLPERSGLEVLVTLREEGERLPVVLITGSAPEDLEEHLDGDTVVLHKPFPMADLAECVRGFLGEG